ncbi:MAG: hypothetical protein QXG39_08540 [Candidatus Aenigmatarchaeota archaeon]
MKLKRTEKDLIDFFDLEKKPFDLDREILRQGRKLDSIVNKILFKNPHPFSAQGTIFFPPKHPKLAKAITIVSPEKARESIRKVAQMKGLTRRQKISALILASNRALALAKKKHLSARERKELKEVAEILRRGAKRL